MDPHLGDWIYESSNLLFQVLYVFAELNNISKFVGYHFNLSTVIFICGSSLFHVKGKRQQFYFPRVIEFGKRYRQVLPCNMFCLLSVYLNSTT